MFEAYKVGVRLSLINNVSSGLGTIISQFKIAGGDSAKLQKSLSEIKLLGMAGAAMGAAGFMGLGLIAKTVKPAEEYAHQLTLMNTAGMKHLEIVNATKAAWAAVKTVPTSSVSENLEAVRDLRMVFGDTSHATEYMPTLQKIQGILSTVRHGGAGAVRAEAYELAKALEMKGAVRNPQEFIVQADAMTKALVSAGGKVNATDFLSAFKYGRAATTGWNDEFTYKILPTLIQEMKGGGGSATGGPGSALMSAYAAVVGGIVSQRALKTWDKVGLLDRSKVEWTKVGEAKGVRPGGILGNDVFQRDPYAWTQQYLVPSLQKAGYLTIEQQKQALQYLFPNRTAGFVMTQFATQAWKFERDKKLIAGASGLAGYEDLLKNDPIMAQMALQKQWNSLLAILGFQIMPELIRGMQFLIKVIPQVSGFIKDHGHVFKVLGLGIVAVSTLLIGGGASLGLIGAFKAISLLLPIIIGSGSTVGLMGLSIALTAINLASIAAAAGVGYLLGTIINSGINGVVKWATNGKQDTLGGAFYDWTHSGTFYENNKNKAIAPSFNHNLTYIDSVRPNTGNKPVQVTTKINLDGRSVANVVTNHQANAADRPQLSSGMFDTLLTPSPVSY